MKEQIFDYAEETPSRLEGALVDYVYTQAIAGLVSISICATVILIALYGISSKPLLLSWYLIFIGLIVCRFVLMKYYQNHNERMSPAQKHAWKNYFIIGTAISGAGWGLLGTVLLPHDPGLPQLLVILILAGVTAAAVPLFSAIRSAAILFFSFSLLPTVMHLWTWETREYFLLASTVVLYWGFLIFLTIKSNQLIVKTVKLVFENDELLKNLLITKKELETINKQLANAATHDGLTKLPNRTFFLFSLERAIKRANRSKKFVGIFYFDLDGFKAINDNFGRQMGDKLLIEIANRLKRRLRAEDFLARLGGDEFAMILENLQNISDYLPIAENVRHLIAQPFLIENHLVEVSASIGISFYPTDGQDPETLLLKADKAMYYIKKKSSNNFYCVCDIK